MVLQNSCPSTSMRKCHLHTWEDKQEQQVFNSISTASITVSIVTEQHKHIIYVCSAHLGTIHLTWRGMLWFLGKTNFSQQIYVSDMDRKKYSESTWCLKKIVFVEKTYCREDTVDYRCWLTKSLTLRSVVSNFATFDRHSSFCSPLPHPVLSVSPASKCPNTRRGLALDNSASYVL